MRSVDSHVAQEQPLLHLCLWAKNVIISTSTHIQRLIQRSSQTWIRRRRHGTRPYSFDIGTSTGDASDQETLRWSSQTEECGTQERQESANSETNLSSSTWSTSLLPAQSHFSNEQVSGETRSMRRTKFKFVSKNGNQVATWKTSKPGFSLKDKKEQILAEVRSEIQKHELQAESDRRCIQELNWNHWFSANGNWSFYYYKCVSNPGDMNHNFKKKYQNKIGIFVKLVSGISETWKNCRKVTCLRSTNFEEKIDWRLWGSNFIDSQAVEIVHTRTGYEQSRREQALLHEELKDRERALRDTRVSIQKLEELKRD